MTKATTPRRSWPLSVADTAIVALMLGVLAIGVGRFLLVAGATATIAARPAPAGTTSVPRRLSVAEAISWGLVKDPMMAQWWGGRFVPRPKGDDYLKVLTERSTLRALGPIMGTVVEREKANGVRIVRVFVPEDNDGLLGGKSATVYTTAGGGTTSTSWAPVGRSAANFTTTPFVVRSYPPDLTDAQVVALEAETKLTTITRDVRVAGPVTDGSGTWILYAHPTPSASKGREFLLIPIELDPNAGTL